MNQTHFLYDELNKMIKVAIDQKHNIESKIRDYFKKQDRRLK